MSGEYRMPSPGAPVWRARAGGGAAGKDPAINRAPMAKVGGEVDAFCTKCELVLAHTVHAMVGGGPVKVECNTCHGVHRYKDPSGAAAQRLGETAGTRGPPR